MRALVSLRSLNTHNFTTGARAGVAGVPSTPSARSPILDGEAPLLRPFHFATLVRYPL